MLRPFRPNASSTPQQMSGSSTHRMTVPSNGVLPLPPVTHQAIACARLCGKLFRELSVLTATCAVGTPAIDCVCSVSRASIGKSTTVQPVSHRAQADASLTVQHSVLCDTSTGVHVTSCQCTIHQYHCKSAKTTCLCTISCVQKDEITACIN